MRLCSCGSWCSVRFSTLVFPFSKMLFMNFSCLRFSLYELLKTRVEYSVLSNPPVEGTVNSMEKRLQSFVKRITNNFVISGIIPPSSDIQYPFDVLHLVKGRNKKICAHETSFSALYCGWPWPLCTKHQNMYGIPDTQLRPSFCFYVSGKKIICPSLSLY